MPVKKSLLFLLLLLLTWPGWALADTDLAAARKFNEGCLRCHGAQGLHTRSNGQKISLYVDESKYFSSIHGTNRCTTCHTDITDYPHVGAKTGAELRRLVESNCRRCHDYITRVYDQSAHGLARRQGKPTALCQDCHGKHDIRKKEDPLAHTSGRNQTASCTASGCHSGRIKESYTESFHGKAVDLGGTRAATCSGCHGSHNILGPKDPASPVNKVNVPQTCAKCHFRAEPNFAKGTEHFLLEKEGPGSPMYYTLKFFVWLTIGVMVLLTIHMELELYRKWKAAKGGGSYGSH